MGSRKGTEDKPGICPSPQNLKIKIRNEGNIIYQIKKVLSYHCEPG
jgi:hypothetical protein